MELVREQADALPQAWPPRLRRTFAVQNFSAVRRRERCKERDERRLAGAVRPEEADDLAGLRGQRDPCERAPTTEMPRDVEDANAIEVVDHAATPARSAGSGPASSVSSAP